MMHVSYIKKVGIAFLFICLLKGIESLHNSPVYEFPSVIYKNEVRNETRETTKIFNPPKKTLIPFTLFFPLMFFNKNMSFLPEINQPQYRVMNNPQAFATVSKYKPPVAAYANTHKYNADTKIDHFPTYKEPKRISPPRTVLPPPAQLNQKAHELKVYNRIEEKCICVPYYLCKEGIINSGGKLQAQPFKHGTRNRTRTTQPFPSKIINPRASLTREGLCDSNRVCCKMYFEENIGEDYYPVATPPPELPRFPAVGKCGTRSAYGIQGRLSSMQYSADRAEFGEYPWQVAVLEKTNVEKNLYLCGGVLISPIWVATVAHCVKKHTQLLVRLGEWDVNRKDEVYPYLEKKVETVVIHPQFNPENLENDIALLRMADPVDSRIPHITPVCLPQPRQVFQDHRCWVSGWGKDSFGSKGAYQNVLKKVDVAVVSRSLCNIQLRATSLGPHFTLHPGVLCAGGEPGKDACTGDGGSPLVCKNEGLWYVVGLVSWGVGCGRAGVPGAYVNVLHYTHWIDNITHGN